MLDQGDGPMRCGQLQDWLRELTSYPTPHKIASYLKGELAAIEAEDAAESPPPQAPRPLRALPAPRPARSEILVAPRPLLPRRGPWDEPRAPRRRAHPRRDRPRA